MKKGITLYLESDLIEEFEKACKDTGRSVSWIINSFLESNKKEILNLIGGRKK